MCTTRVLPDMDTRTSSLRTCRINRLHLAKPSLPLAPLHTMWIVLSMQRCFPSSALVSSHFPFPPSSHLFVCSSHGLTTPLHHATQFVGLCRGLGLRARYVACVDPLPPHPRPRRASKQTRANTVDLAAEKLRGQQQKRQRNRYRGGGSAWGCEQRRARAPGSRAWAEVLCRDDGDLVSFV